MLCIERQLYELSLEASVRAIEHSTQPFAVDTQNAVQILRLIEEFLISTGSLFSLSIVLYFNQVQRAFGYARKYLIKYKASSEELKLNSAQKGQIWLSLLIKVISRHLVTE